MLCAGREKGEHGKIVNGAENILDAFDDDDLGEWVERVMEAAAAGPQQPSEENEDA